MGTGQGRMNDAMRHGKFELNHDWARPNRFGSEVEYIRFDFFQYSIEERNINKK